MSTILTHLTHQWQEAKQQERDAATRRVAVESAIWEQVCTELPDKGTTTLDTGMKIVTGFAESWDQEQIQRAYQQWPEGRPFPFKGEWVPDGRTVAYLRENEPELYRLIEPCLTLKPKKPAFSVKEGA